MGLQSALSNFQYIIARASWGQMPKHAGRITNMPRVGAHNYTCSLIYIWQAKSRFRKTLVNFLCVCNVFTAKLRVLLQSIYYLLV